MKLIFLSLFIIFFTSGAHAAEKCSKDFIEPMTIVKGMADFKAAMDAGYAACTVNYPKEFAPLQSINDFMQVNMQSELDNARTILNQILSKESEGCQSTMSEHLDLMIEGQYKKAYARRYRVMSKADLVGRDQDSCLIVLDMVQKYDKHYGDFKQLDHLLYSTSKEKGKASGLASARAYRKFEKARDLFFENEERLKSDKE
jgi:hypothetical protein